MALPCPQARFCAAGHAKGVTARRGEARRAGHPWPTAQAGASSPPALETAGCAGAGGAGGPVDAPFSGVLAGPPLHVGARLLQPRAPTPHPPLPLVVSVSACPRAWPWPWGPWGPRRGLHPVDSGVATQPLRPEASLMGSLTPEGGKGSMWEGSAARGQVVPTPSWGHVPGCGGCVMGGPDPVGWDWGASAVGRWAGGVACRGNEMGRGPPEAKVRAGMPAAPTRAGPGAGAPG